jgi:poly(A) polymerase
VRREAEAEVAPAAIRRLAALLPQAADVAAGVAARLRLSKKAAKRLVSAAVPDEGTPPAVLAYRIGADEAVDRILLGDRDPADARALANWARPQLQVRGGDLIAMGLEAGPAVAATLQAVEREWTAAGFPHSREEQQAIARRFVDQALRARQ